MANSHTLTRLCYGTEWEELEFCSKARFPTDRLRVDNLWGVEVV